MGFGRRRNAHAVSVPAPTDNAHGDRLALRTGTAQGLRQPAVTGQSLGALPHGWLPLPLRAELPEHSGGLFLTWISQRIHDLP